MPSKNSTIIRISSCARRSIIAPLSAATVHYRVTLDRGRMAWRRFGQPVQSIAPSLSCTRFPQPLFFYAPYFNRKVKNGQRIFHNIKKKSILWENFKKLYQINFVCFSFWFSQVFFCTPFLFSLLLVVSSND